MRTKGNDIAKKPELKPFEWMTKHQEVFDALKKALNTAPVLRYPDFSREFILETDVSLNGLGAILSQRGKGRKIHVIAYASCSLCPSERSMCNYSSAKLGAVCAKMGCNREVLELFTGPVVSSLHRQQSTHMCAR